MQILQKGVNFTEKGEQIKKMQRLYLAIIRFRGKYYHSEIQDMCTCPPH